MKEQRQEPKQEEQRLEPMLAPMHAQADGGPAGAHLPGPTDEAGPSSVKQEEGQEKDEESAAAGAAPQGGPPRCRSENDSHLGAAGSG